MAKRYQVLARKYRPQAFQEVVGQEPAVTTLKNAILYNKIAHAYLFCGSRGVGKTTLARLFAKALNCQALSPEQEPCNQCPSCLEILSGQSLDVIEIDGASNRGIDDIRQINETVGYAPSYGKYKIYIIDEVHMLTKEAFNALLKTLEEPPEQAKFFFATTEPHKVLPTIISRCQRFDLARIQPPVIVSKLAQISADLSRKVESEALDLIAAFAEGSLRDAESLFDQILCFSEKEITASIVRQTLGLVPQELFQSLDAAFSNYHLAYAFELVDQLFQTGKDLSHFLEQLIEHYRNIVHAKCKNSDSSSSAKLYTQQQALHILDLLVQAESSFQKSTFQRIALECLLLQIIRSKNRIPVEILVKNLTEGMKAQETQLFQAKEPLQKEQVAEIKESLTLQVKVAELKPVPFNPYVAKKEEPNTQEVASSIAEGEKAPEIQPLPINEPPKTEVVTEIKEFPTAQVKAAESKPIPLDLNRAKREELHTQKVPPVEVSSSILVQKPQSHYDTIMRFAAVEFEGTIKN